MSKRIGICSLCQRKRWMRSGTLCQVCYYRELASGRILRRPSRYDQTIEIAERQGIVLISTIIDHCGEQVERDRRVALYAKRAALRIPLFDRVPETLDRMLRYFVEATKELHG